MSADVIRQEFVQKYLNEGEQKFSRFLLVYSLNKLIAIEKGDYKGTNPDSELMDYYEKLIFLYRKDSNEVHLEMARVFRKIAHKVYRIMLKKNMTTKNVKFLNLV